MEQRYAYLEMSEPEAREADQRLRTGRKPRHHGHVMRARPDGGYQCDSCSAAVVLVSDEEAARLAKQGAIDLRD